MDFAAEINSGRRQMQGPATFGVIVAVAVFLSGMLWQGSGLVASVIAGIVSGLVGALVIYLWNRFRASS
jgi:hypothetical protein